MKELGERRMRGEKKKDNKGEKRKMPEANHPGSCQTDTEEVGKVGHTGKKIKKR